MLPSDRLSEPDTGSQAADTNGRIVVQEPNWMTMPNPALSFSQLLVDLRRKRLADLAIAFVLRFVECLDIRMNAHDLLNLTMGCTFLRSKGGLQDQGS